MRNDEFPIIEDVVADELVDKIRRNPAEATVVVFVSLKLREFLLQRRQLFLRSLRH